MAEWIDALASRSGPLQNAAAHFAASQGLERDPPRGAAGLGALARLIGRARCELHDDEHARRFLEGAGAYLSLILLDHWQHAEHAVRDGMHRLRLGDSGTFDPFAAVAHALDADNAPRTLLEEVKLAEDEAQGCGPIARVVQEVRRALRAVPDARVIEHFDMRLWLELDGTRIELDLSRVVEVTRGESAAILQAAVGRLCAPLVRDAIATSELPWHAAQALIFPRLVGPGFVRALPPDQGDLQLTRLGSEVWEALVLRTRERARYVRSAEVRNWSKDGAAPRAQALQNLARASGRARFLQHDTTDGPLVIAQSRDGLDAARLLLPGLYDLLAPQLGSPFLLAVPHRDTLLACALKPPGLVDELTRRVAAAVSSAPHAISRQLLLVTGPSVWRDFAAAP